MSSKYSTDSNGSGKSSLRDSKRSNSAASSQNHIDTDMNELLAIEVNFGKGRSDIVRVKFDDTPEDLAAQFVKKHKLKPQTTSTISNHFKKTIDTFKKKSIEMRPQSPVLDEEDSFIGDSVGAVAGMYSIAGLQEPSDLPPSPPSQPTVSFSLRDHNNKIPLSIDDAADMVENKSPPAPSTSNLQLIKPPIVRSPSTSSDTPTKPKTRNRRLSDGIIFSTLRSITRWSPSASFRSDNDKMSISSVTPRSDAAPVEKDNNHSNSSESENHSMHAVSEYDDIQSMLEKASEISLDVALATRPSIESSSTSEHVGSSDKQSSTIRDSLDKPQSVNGSFSNMEGLGIPETTFDSITEDTYRASHDPIFDHNDPIDEETEAEASYYRIQQSYYKSTLHQQQHNQSQQLHNSPFTNRLEPRTTIISLSNNNTTNTNINSASRIATLMAKQRVAKTAHERLFLSACITKERKDTTEKTRDDEAIKDISSNQYKMSKKSRALSANKRRIMLPIPNSPNSGNFRGYSIDPDIPASLHERLYVEAKYDAARKNKLMEINDNLKKAVPHDDYWSCSRCGTIHEIPRPVITSLYTFSVKEPDKTRICSKCSWNQTNHEEFKPMNVGLSLLPDNDDIKEAINRRKQERLQQYHADQSMSIFGVNDNNTAPTIHDMLYKDTQNQASKIIYTQAIAQIHNRENTFHPTIPDTSKEMLRQKIEKESSGSAPTSPDFCTTSNETKLGDYFSQAPYERLYKTKHLRVDQYLIQGQHNADIDMQRLTSLQMNHAATTTSPSSSHLKRSTSSRANARTLDQKLSKKMTTLIDRLTSEFQQRDQKRQHATKEFYSKDPITGKPLFQPTIGPKPSHICDDGDDDMKSSNAQRQHRDIFAALHEEDGKKRLKQKIVEANAHHDMKESMKKSQVHALPQSETILKQCTQHSIDELFRLLLATNTVVAYHDQYHIDVSKEELLLHISQEADELQDHEQDEIRDWKKQVIDLNKLHLSLLVPSIQKLVYEVIVEKIAWNNKHPKKSIQNKNQPADDNGDLLKLASSSEPNDDRQDGDIIDTPNLDGVVDYDDFSKFVSQAMKRREGTGKWYVVPPKVRQDAVVQMIREQQLHHTYAPNIPRMSHDLSEAYRSNNRGNGIRTVDALYQEAETFEYRRRSKQEAIKAEEETELTFKPKLYRPPTYVKPKYRDSTAPVSSSSSHNSPIREPSSLSSSSMKVATDSRANSVNLSRRRQAELRHISRSRGMVKTFPKEVDIPQPIETQASSSSNPTTYDRGKSPNRTTTSTNRNTLSASQQPETIENAVQPTRSRPTSTSRSKLKSSSYLKLHAPPTSTLTTTNQHQSQTSASQHRSKAPVLPYEKLHPASPPKPHEQASKPRPTSIRMIDHVIAEPAEFMRYWGINDLPATDLSSFIDHHSVSPKSLSHDGHSTTHIFHSHHHHHPNHPHTSSQMNSAFVTHNSGHPSPPTAIVSSHKSSNPSTSSFISTSLLSTAASSTATNGIAPHSRVDEHSNAGSRRSLEGHDEAASARSNHSASNLRPTFNRRSSHPNSSKRSITQRPSNDSLALSIDLEHDHDSDCKLHAKTDRMSLSSMLSSLIHGDTPKPLGKHMDLSPEPSPTKDLPH